MKAELVVEAKGYLFLGKISPRAKAHVLAGVFAQNGGQRRVLAHAYFASSSRELMQHTGSDLYPGKALDLLSESIRKCDP